MDNEIISLSLLREAEQMAIDGAAKFLAGRDEIAIALHRISTQKLYLAELDEHGLPLYKTFESYWPDIKQKMGGDKPLSGLQSIRRCQDSHWAKFQS